VNIRLLNVNLFFTRDYKNSQGATTAIYGEPKKPRGSTELIIFIRKKPER
jgi:hypothetical protein